jgi:hypothetical protein
MKGMERLLIIFGVFVFYVALLVVVNVIINTLDSATVSIEWTTWIISAAIIVGTQIIFILPMVQPPRLTVRGKSLLLSTCMASFIAALLTLTLVTFVYSTITTMVLNLPKQDEINESFFWIILWASWAVWTICLLIYVHRQNRDPSTLVRCTSWLFAGSLVEFLLSIPLAIMVARRSNCYCATGSFVSLALSFVAAIWLFGPFMIILLVWRKRPWTKDHCFNCGYPRKLINSTVCSECGIELS